jgi:hypothetical protein
MMMKLFTLYFLIPTEKKNAHYNRSSRHPIHAKLSVTAVTFLLYCGGLSGCTILLYATQPDILT